MDTELTGHKQIVAFVTNFQKQCFTGSFVNNILKCSKNSQTSLQMSTKHLVANNFMICCSMVHLRLTYGPFYNNLTTRRPLPVKWYKTQQNHKVWNCRKKI